MGPFEIRPLLPGDAAQVGALHVRIWRETYAGLMPPEVLTALDEDQRTRWWADVLTDTHTSRSWGAFRGGPCGAREELMGWITVGVARDRNAPTARELWVLNVAPEHQGRGVAHELMTKGLGDAAAHLWVVEGNARAVAFYRRHGFGLDGASRIEPEGNTDLRMTRVSV